MTCSNSALYPSNSTDALFRAWGSAISTAIRAAGWTVAGDTGQINWATVTAPGVAATVAGYEVYRTADALTNWYLKIEYGSGGYANYPSIWITVGTGTNGGGTLTGQLSTRYVFGSASYSASTQYNCAFAGGPSWLAIAMFYDGGNNGFALLIERLKDSTGADADTGVVFHSASNGHRVFQVVPLTGSVGAQNDATTYNPSYPMMTPPYGMQTAAVGATVGVCTIHPWLQVHYPAILGAVAYFTNTPDIPVGATFSVNRYGASHAYLALGSPFSCNALMAMAIRYE